ncbi:hypothetical protein ACIQNU_27955 [Streptomyces sp. NPDC091292]|uniref:hypothetical protein n=1 Tax=Streptomyces sp. NPDC091292 TaxID=3365991 RepID=UPI00382B48C6
MSATTSRTTHRAPRGTVWGRALVVLVAVLGTAFASGSPAGALPAPPALVSTESGETHPCPEPALRPPARPTAAPPAPGPLTTPERPRTARPPLATRTGSPTGAMRALRTVVLRC